MNEHDRDRIIEVAKNAPKDHPNTKMSSEISANQAKVLLEDMDFLEQ